MQSIQLSPAKFTREELAEQQQELASKTVLLANTVAIDEVTVLFFNQEGQAEIVPHQEFCSIIQKPIPPIKSSQIAAIERITYCFYCMLVEGKLENLQSIQVCYEGYMDRTTYFSKFVSSHEKVRKWCKELLHRRDLTRSKQALVVILKEMREADQVRLEIMEWKVSVCLILFDIIFEKLRVERGEMIKLLKVFRTLKRENKISSKPAFNALRFIIKHLILIKSDLYMFFERQLKLWCQEIVDNSLIAEMKELIEECQEITANSLKDFTSNKLEQTTFRASNINKTTRKTVANTLNPHLFKDSTPSALISRRFVRRRMSKEKEETFLKKVNHFLKIRQNIEHRSLEATPRNSVKSRLKISIKMSQKPSVSLHSISRFTFDQAIVMKTAMKSNKEQKKPQGSKEISAISLAASKSASCFSKTGSHRRKNIYAKIIEKEGKSLAELQRLMMEEMLSLKEVQLQRCNITLEEILIGQFKKVQDDPNIKFVGAAQDSQFGVLSLTFFTIFNQELASISFLIRQVSKRGYILKCKIRSTYCIQPTVFKINKYDKSDEFTLDELNESISKSVIYYEALQEKIERKIGVSELQGMEEILRECKGYQLSQDQLTKLLLSVDLLEGEFFWYYTKSNYVNGCRIERRVSIDFTNLSAFAVSLGKFKSDYDSCLSEIVLVENIKSLQQTCVYLSHGRKIVYKSLRKIKDVFYLEVITIAEDVYKSFSRKDRKPYFKNTQVQRVLLKVQDFNETDSKQLYEESLDSRSLKVNLLECMKEEDIFIFFMKNIVENFIEIKYLRRMEKYLLKVNAQENYEVFDEKLIVPYQKHSLDVVQNHEQICDLKEFRPNVHSSIKHFRGMLIKYCEVYELHPFLTIAKQSSHIIYIRKTAYIVHQTTLKNNLRLLKISKRSKGYNYSIFLYHQNPLPITLLNTPFRSRFVMIDKTQVVGNLIRRSKAQMLLSEQCSNVTKVVIRYEKGYCYAVVSECQNVVSWKIDYYFPHKQAQYSTFLDEQIFLQCLGQWGENEQMWNESIKQIKIDLDRSCIQIHDKQVSLFRSIKKLYFYEDTVKGSLQLILLEGQLSFLITNFQSGLLSLGKVENTMFLNNKSIFSSISSSKESIEMYDNIMNHLYYKLINGKLPAQPIQTDHFIGGKQL